jgi:hypothetical protein
MPDSELTGLPEMTLDRELTEADQMYVVDVDDPANTSKRISAARMVWSADGQPVRIYGGPVDLHLAGETYLPAISEGTALVDTESQQTVSNKTLNQATINSPTIVTPTISATGWGAANHSHSSTNRGGTIDHGALTGRSDDDHTQYHTDARADALYYRKGSVWTRTEANNRFAELSHTHNYAAASHNHDSRYYTQTELATSGQASVHWNNVKNEPSFAASSHTHNYAASSHTHNYAASNHTHGNTYITQSELAEPGQAEVAFGNLSGGPFMEQNFIWNNSNVSMGATANQTLPSDCQWWAASWWGRAGGTYNCSGSFVWTRWGSNRTLPVWDSNSNIMTFTYTPSTRVLSVEAGATLSNFYLAINRMRFLVE